MLDVEISFDDINVSSVEREDLPQIQSWMELEKQFIGNKNNLEELTERFLESYVSECEFFLKISKKGEIIGILKGRLELKNPNEVWIWFFYVSNRYRKISLNTRVIQELINYFTEEYGIDIFFTRIVKNDFQNLNLWKDVGFRIVRMVENFYKIDGKYMDMLIMKKYSSV